MSLPARQRRSRALHVAAALLLLPALAAAQYKVIGPDGKVTYTDRSPSPSEGRVTSLNARGGIVQGDPDLPFELRAVVAKYPVTLYSAAGLCDPCQAARQLLRQRGIPYAERLIVTPDDSDALEQRTGGREAPTLTIGQQSLRGLSSDVWGSYLDAAGYPRTSVLPSSYQYKAATPLIQQRDAMPAAVATAPTQQAPQPAAPRPPGGIKF